MAFVKTFPRTLKGSTYPIWEEIGLTEQEEKEMESMAKEENIKLMEECVEESKALLARKGYKDYQSDVIRMAVQMFSKIASHSVYWKEQKAKEKFDLKFKEK